jgi:hypothetical protein
LQWDDVTRQESTLVRRRDGSEDGETGLIGEIDERNRWGDFIFILSFLDRPLILQWDDGNR